MSDDPFGDLIGASAPKTIAPVPTAAPAPKPVQAQPSNDPFGELLKNPSTEASKEQGPVPSWSEVPGKAASNFIPDAVDVAKNIGCLLYTSDAADD